MQINKIFKSGIVIAFSLALPFSLVWSTLNLPHPINTATLNASNNITTNGNQATDSAKVNTSGTKYWGTKQSAALNTIHQDGVFVNQGGNNEGMITVVSTTDPTTKVGGPYEFVLYDRNNGQINSNFHLTQNGNPFQIMNDQYLLDYFVNGHYFYVVVMNGLQKVEFNCFNLNNGARDDSISFEYALDADLQYKNTRGGDNNSKTLYVTGAQSYEDPNTYFLAATRDIQGSERIKVYAFDIAKPLKPLIVASEYAPMPYTSTIIPCGLVEYNGEIIIYSISLDNPNISTTTFEFDPKGLSVSYKATWSDNAYPMDHNTKKPTKPTNQPTDQVMSWEELNDIGLSLNQIRTFIIPINETQFYSFMYFDNPSGQHSIKWTNAPMENWLIMTKLDSTQPKKWNGNYRVNDPGYYRWINLNILGDEKATETSHGYSTISYTHDALYVEEVVGQDKTGADNYKIYEIPAVSKDSSKITTLDDIFATESEITNGTKFLINDSPKDYLYSTVIPINKTFENTIAKPEMMVTDTGGAIIIDKSMIGSNTVNEYQIAKTNGSYIDINDNNKNANLVATFYNYESGNNVPDFDGVLDGNIFNQTITHNKFDKEYSRNANLTKIETTFESRLIEANNSFKGSINVNMSNFHAKSKDFFTGVVDFSYKATGASAWTNRAVHNKQLDLSHDVFMFDWIVTGSIIAASALIIILATIIGVVTHKNKKKRDKNSRNARLPKKYTQLINNRSKGGSTRKSNHRSSQMANDEYYDDDGYDDGYDNPPPGSPRNNRGR